MAITRKHLLLLTIWSSELWSIFKYVNAGQEDDWWDDDPVIEDRPLLADPRIYFFFGGNNTNTDIYLEYNISDLKYDLEATILDVSCDTNDTIPETSIALRVEKDENYTLDNTAHARVILDIKENEIINDKQVFEELSEYKIRLQFCLQADLVLRTETDNGTISESMTFKQERFDFNLTTIRDFKSGNITLAKAGGPGEMNASVGVDYDINAYQCNIAGRNSSYAIVPSDSVFICIDNPSGASVYDISTLKFTETKGRETLTAILGRKTNAVTSKRVVRNGQGTKWLVQTRLVSRFFSYTDIMTVIASGLAIVSLSGEMAQRRLQQVRHPPKALSSETSEFNVELMLKPLNQVHYMDGSVSSTSIKNLGRTTIFVTIVVFISTALYIF